MIDDPGGSHEGGSPSTTGDHAMRRAYLLVLLLTTSCVVSLPLAGCGDDDDSALIEAKAASQTATDVVVGLEGRRDELEASLESVGAELEAMPADAAGRDQALATVADLQAKLDDLEERLARAVATAEEWNASVQALESSEDVPGFLLEVGAEVAQEHAPADWKPWIGLAVAVAGGIASEVGRRREKRVSSGMIESIDASRVGSGADGTIVLDSARLRTEQVSKGIRETVKARRKKAAG